MTQEDFLAFIKKILNFKGISIVILYHNFYLSIFFLVKTLKSQLCFKPVFQFFLIC